MPHFIALGQTVYEKRYNFFTPFSFWRPRADSWGQSSPFWVVVYIEPPRSSCQISSSSETPSARCLLPKFVDFVDGMTDTHTHTHARAHANSRGLHDVSACHVATITESLMFLMMLCTYTVHSPSVIVFNKCSAAAEMGDRLATIDMDRKLGGAVPFLGRAGSPSNTMWPGPRPTIVPSDIVIHPAIWPQ